jgi:cell division protein FtsB
MSDYTKELANRLRIGGVFIWVEAADELDRLRVEVGALKSENATLKKQRGDLCYEVNKLEDEIRDLHYQRGMEP